MIRLPLWALRQSDACKLDERVAAFEAHHGHAPDDTSTWSEWCAVTPSPDDRLWATACALPRVYPDHRRGLLLAVVEVAYLAARRVQPERDADEASVAALALVRRWLDGEDVSAAALEAAADATADQTPRAVAGSATRATNAIAWSVIWDSAAEDVVHYANAATYGAANYDPTWTTPNDPAVCAAERAQQREDLDRLLLALSLPNPEVPLD